MVLYIRWCEMPVERAKRPPFHKPGDRPFLLHPRHHAGTRMLTAFSEWRCLGIDHSSSHLLVLTFSWPELFLHAGRLKQPLFVMALTVVEGVADKGPTDDPSGTMVLVGPLIMASLWPVVVGCMHFHVPSLLLVCWFVHVTNHALTHLGLMAWWAAPGPC